MSDACTNCNYPRFSNATFIDGLCAYCYVTRGTDEMSCCSGDFDHGVVEHRHSCWTLKAEYGG